jgi:hypothetical protein
LKREEHFLFQPGEWLGAGQVSFSMSPDVLHFRTKWEVAQESHEVYSCTQTVEIVGGDRMINNFEITPDSPTHFAIELENDELGVFQGTGFIDDKTVAWEFRDKNQDGAPNESSFEGFEVYKKVEEDEYTMHAEYLATDQTRTMIRGRIWRRAHFREGQE